MARPFFSIIIPSLNEEKYLPLLLSDLAAQTFRDFEVIVSDGKSDDNTVKASKKWTRRLPRLKIVIGPKRHVCAQRNLGAKHARADWLIFLDADNRLPSYFLQGIKYRLESEPCDLATCWLQSDDSSTKDVSIAHAINYASELLKNSQSPVIMEAMLITSRQAFATLSGFDESINFAEGRTLLLKAKKMNLKYAIYKTPAYMTSFRRFRSYGTLSIAANLAQHELAKLFDIPISKTKLAKLYPMVGGKLYDTAPTKRKRFTDRIQTLFKDFHSPESFKQKLRDLLQD